MNSKLFFSIQIATTFLVGCGGYHSLPLSGDGQIEGAVIPDDELPRRGSGPDAVSHGSKRPSYEPSYPNINIRPVKKTAVQPQKSTQRPRLPTPQIPGQAKQPQTQKSQPNPVSTAARGSIGQQLASYSQSFRVQSMIGTAMLNKRPRFTGHCYHYVKTAVYSGGLAQSGSLPGASAYMALRDLKSQGFQNLLEHGEYLDMIGMNGRSTLQAISKNPHLFPVGAILVFAGDSTYRDGDVAIKTPEGYVSDYFSYNPITNQWNGSHFHLTGIMVKL